MGSDMGKMWEPFSQLWVTAYHWQKDSKEWKDGPFDGIDAKYCETSVQNGAKTLFKAVKAFEKREGTAKVLAIAKDFKEKIDEFAPNVPIVVGLRNTGMRERHWEQVSKMVGAKVDPQME